MFELVTARCYA